ncbi:MULTISPECIES: FAD:protein FMN transferase [Brevibacillus]|uniref:FAD:protein FMN transferase n=1 Tax=Brevibacillus TaxID=55080 RepID=UPI000E2FE56F|nr:MULTISPECIES: FAD:protein FMN transferase [Brevibacillus]MED1787291.1 FAD:protein FMN transferase [Brevibacillus laterosporus]RFB38451.1 FAD:protein FMN transferase [Brevibacillus sp. VP]
MKHKFSLLFFLLLSLILNGCVSKTHEESVKTAIQPQSESFFIYDTIVTVRVYDDRMTDKHFKELEARMKEIESHLSRTLQGSEVYRINEQAGKQAVPVSRETYEVIKKSIQFAELSEGQFDPAIGPLVSLWNIGHDNAKVPSEEKLTEALQVIDYHQIVLDDAKRTVFLKQPNMAIDLGGIGKGYAADQIAVYLTEKGFTSAIIDLGGNILALGKKPNGNDWIIGIQDPDRNRGNQLGKLKVTNKTVVTSGIYERYFEENGKLYHHILNPATGYPVENNLFSVSIITNESADADALSTTGFALGLEKGMPFMESLPNVEAIFITKDKNVYITSGLKGNWELTNEQYKMAN